MSPSDITPERLDSWDQVTKCFDSFESPRLNPDGEGSFYQTGWLFRGHKLASYKLEPTIERVNRHWAALEELILYDFKSKARLHMDTRDLQPADRLSWLAVMQHYGVPTRLLDFTYSPYIALYFALRETPKEFASQPAAVWAIDPQALLQVARTVCIDADKAQAMSDGASPNPKRGSFRWTRSGVSLIP